MKKKKKPNTNFVASNKCLALDINFLQNQIKEAKFPARQP